MPGLAIIGCGGFGREVWGIATAINLKLAGTWVIKGFIDDDPSIENATRVELLGSSVLGPLSCVETLDSDTALVIAVGAADHRERIAADIATLTQGTAEFAVLVHPDSTVGTDVTLGAGTVIAAGARLSTNITVGSHVHIDHNATVGHDTELAAFVRLNPQACVSGSVRIGTATTVGASATVLQGLSVGRRVVIGAGAVVVRDVLDGLVVKGVPAQ